MSINVDTLKLKYSIIQQQMAKLQEAKEELEDIAAKAGVKLGQKPIV